MKFNVYTKVLAAFFIIALLFIFFFFKYMKSIEIEIAVNGQKTTTVGLLNDLESRLIKIPSSSWNKVIKNRQKDGIYLKPINDLDLSKQQIKTLTSGKITYSYGRALQFLNLVMNRAAGYKRIGSSSKALVYYFSLPESGILQSIPI